MIIQCMISRSIERHTDHNQEIKTSTVTETSYKNTCCARYEKPGTKNHPKLWPKNMWNLGLLVETAVVQDPEERVQMNVTENNGQWN